MQWKYGKRVVWVRGKNLKLAEIRRRSLVCFGNCWTKKCRRLISACAEIASRMNHWAGSCERFVWPRLRRRSFVCHVYGIGAYIYSGSRGGINAHNRARLKRMVAALVSSSGGRLGLSEGESLVRLCSVVWQTSRYHCIYVAGDLAGRAGALSCEMSSSCRRAHMKRKGEKDAETKKSASELYRPTYLCEKRRVHFVRHN